MVLASLYTLENLKTIAAGVGAVATIIAGIGVIYVRAIGPYLAKPLAKAVRQELEDAVEAIVLSDRVLIPMRDIIEEVVAAESKEILRLLRNHDRRLIIIERDIASLPKRKSDE